MSQYTFHYFDAYGRAENVRILLAYCNVNYDDHRIKMHEWGALKASFPGGQIPCLEFPDGTKLGQTMSMLRYLGQVHGAYPTDPVAQYECDYISDNYAELFDKLAAPKFKSGDE